MPFKPIDPEVYAEADRLINEEKLSIAETSRRVGVSAQTLYKRYRSPDPKPGGRRSTTNVKAAKKQATDDQLVSLFSKIAVAPAIPAGLWLHCEFCANHFMTQGPDAARKLVELSHDEPALRRVMEYVYGYAQEYAWGAILATWFGIPIAHHLAPDFLYRWIQIPLGLPPRGEPATHSHSNGHVHADAPAQPFPSPLGDMDMESLMGMARAFGIEVDLTAMTPDEPVTDATIAEDETDADAAEADADADSATEAGATDADADTASEAS